LCSNDYVAPPAEQLVRELAVEVLDSFEKLEVVTCLSRTRGPMSQDELAQALRIERTELVEPLAALAREQIIAAGSQGYELVEGGKWTRHVAMLAALYEEDRIAVVTIMSEAALSRLRRQANRAFADAFVIRAKKKGDSDG
jgi:biotin operon repressor